MSGWASRCHGAVEVADNNAARRLLLGLLHQSLKKCAPQLLVLFSGSCLSMEIHNLDVGRGHVALYPQSQGEGSEGLSVDVGRESQIRLESPTSEMRSKAAIEAREKACNLTRRRISLR